MDVTLYSLKKWAGLACKGNPTALHFLFSAGVLRDPIWSLVAARKSVFLSRVCAKHFVGFANDQFARLSGKKGRGEKGQRSELEQKYGYDVKAAMHGTRLLYECKELMSTGEVTLPRPERDLLIQIRTGRYSLEKVLNMANQLFTECEQAAERSALPERVDRKAVSEVLAECYLRSWQA